MFILAVLIGGYLLRIGMAVIWLTEGLFPKILFQQELELRIVSDSGLVPFAPSAFLVVVGICQLASGIAALLLRGTLLQVVLAKQ